MNQELWQELCEWVGFTYITLPPTRAFFWMEPNGESYHMTKLPPHDMNTLFKWMVPKLELPRIVFNYRKDEVWCTINHLNKYTAKDVNEFEALAQAIYKVVKSA